MVFSFFCFITILAIRKFPREEKTKFGSHGEEKKKRKKRSPILMPLRIKKWPENSS